MASPNWQNVGLVVVLNKASWSTVMFSVHKKTFVFVSLFLGMLLALTTIHGPAFARVEIHNDMGWSEGDPGDGLESVGGGSGSSLAPENHTNEVLDRGVPIPFKAIITENGYYLTIIPVEMGGTIHVLFIAQVLDGDWGAK